MTHQASTPSPKSPQDPEPSRLSHGSEEAGVRAEGVCHLPRVWVGEFQDSTPGNWWWKSTEEGMAWVLYPTGIDTGDIFTPGNQPRPTEDPREMETMATCKEVDWI